MFSLFYYHYQDYFVTFARDDRNHNIWIQSAERVSKPDPIGVTLTPIERDQILEQWIKDGSPENQTKHVGVVQ